MRQLLSVLGRAFMCVGTGTRAAQKEVIQRKYRELFGEEPRSQHRQSLLRQIAWRLQVNAEGGLSERARQRALDIADDADVRRLAPRSEPGARVSNARFDSVTGSAFAQLPASRVFTVDVAQTLVQEAMAKRRADGYEVTALVVDGLNAPNACRGRMRSGSSALSLQIRQTKMVQNNLS
jgi:hypothetical protein